MPVDSDIVRNYDWTSVPRNSALREEAPVAICTAHTLNSNQLQQFVQGYMNTVRFTDTVGDDGIAFYKGLYQGGEIIDTFFFPFFTDNNFSISRLEDVGRRKLAYSIDDHNKGHYLFYYVEGTPENVSEIENKIKFNDMIIRHLFVKINNVPDFESDLKEDSAKEEDKPKKATKSADKKEETKNIIT